MPYQHQFNQVFQFIPAPSLILLPDSPTFTILAVNNAYLETTRTAEKDLIGKGIFEAFPQNPQNKVSKGVENLRNSLEFVTDYKEKHKMWPQKYDLPIRGTSEFKIKYFTPLNIPLLDDDANITHILHTVEDVTDKKLLESSLEIERKRFNDLYFQAPSCMEMIRSSIIRLDGFINNILNYSQNNRTGLESEKIPVTQTINEIIDSVRNIKEARGISFKININEDHCFYSDWHRFNTVIKNLISNAIKYHTKEGQGRYLHLTGTSCKEELNLKISDNGIGIPPEFHEKIFEMFFRLPGNTVGSGLGLYIVKEAIEKMQGTIEVESEKGVGSSFNIRLKNLKVG